MATLVIGVAKLSISWAVTLQGDTMFAAKAIYLTQESFCGNGNCNFLKLIPIIVLYSNENKSGDSHLGKRKR